MNMFVGGHRLDRRTISMARYTLPVGLDNTVFAGLQAPSILSSKAIRSTWRERLVKTSCGMNRVKSLD